MTEHYLIWVSDESWRIGREADGGSPHVETVAMAGDADLPARASAARQQLSAVGYIDQPVMLVVPSAWCLCARIDTRDMDRGHRQQGIGYRLEEHLPISAEDMIADVVDLGDGEAMGVCAEYAKLRAITDALEAAEISVRHICPSAMLIAGWVAEKHPQLDVLLIGGTSEGYDWIGFGRGKPAMWSWFANDVESIRDALADAVKQRDQRLQLGIMGEEPAALCRADISHRVDRLSSMTDDADQATAARAARILDEQVSAWIDFRSGKLAAADQYRRYRRSFAILATSLVLLLVSVIGVTQWRAGRYVHLHRALADQQAEVFKRILPGQRLPMYVRGRLQSEQRKLAGLGGAEADAAAQMTSALIHLQQVLGAMPADVAFRILDLSIEPELIRVDGQAAGHSQAEQLVNALRQAGAYEVEPPKTQLQKDQVVSFLFTAKPRVPSEKKGAIP